MMVDCYYIENGTKIFPINAKYIHFDDLDLKKIAGWMLSS